MHRANTQTTAAPISSAQALKPRTITREVPARIARGGKLRLTFTTSNAALESAILATAETWKDEFALAEAHTAAEEEASRLEAVGCTDEEKAAAKRAEDEAHRVWSRCYDRTDRAAAALLRVKVDNPADLQIQLDAFAMSQGYRRVTDMPAYEDKLRVLEVATAALARFQPPAPIPPTPNDPAARDYRAFRAEEARLAHTWRPGDEPGLEGMTAAADAMLASHPADVAGIAARLGYIVSNAFLHTAGDWDCPDCLHKRPAITPPTDAEFVASGEGQNGGEDALFRALAFLHLGVELLAQQEAAPSRLSTLLAESDRAFSDAGRHEDDTPEQIAADEKADRLHREFLRAPITSPADAIVKLRWISRGIHSGETGYETAVIAQLVEYLGGDPVAVLTVDPRYEAAKLADLTLDFDQYPEVAPQTQNLIAAE